MTHHPSIAIAPLPGAPRQRIESARAIGARSVTLDASLPGLRPRELDRSAVRGLCALLRRAELTLAGLDLPIPPNHLADPAHQDRAVAALAAASDFLTQTAGLAETISQIFITIPNPAGPAAVAAGRHARAAGVTLVNTVRPLPEMPEGFAAGIDLAGELDAGNDPLETLAATPNLAAIRLSDSSAAARCALGGGRLDLAGAHAVIETTARDATLVIDPRGTADPLTVASSSLTAWADAARPAF